MSDTRDRVLEGVDASRRVGWAKAYQAEEMLERIHGLIHEALPSDRTRRMIKGAASSEEVLKAASDIVRLRLQRMNPQGDWEYDILFRVLVVVDGALKAIRVDGERPAPEGTGR